MHCKKKLPAFIGVGMTVLCIVGFALYMMKCSTPNSYFIFRNIDECEQLIPSDQSKLTIERYASPDKDSNLKGLSYHAFWGMKFRSSDLKYEFFAYEFVDSDSALKYFIQATGRNDYKKELPLSADQENKRYSTSRGMFSYSLVVVYRNMAYLVNAPVEYANAVEKLLEDTFSYRVV